MSADPNNRKALALAAAVAIAAPAEGLRHVAYRDPPGILTACRGHTGPDVREGVYYTLEQCDQWLDEDMRKAITIVERCVPGLPWQALAAWGDAVYNLGPTIVCDLAHSTAARLLAAKRYEEACRQLPRWDKATLPLLGLTTLPGLTKRRGKEMVLCLQAYTPPAGVTPALGAQG